MIQDQILTLIAVFTGIAAVALLLQSIAFLGIARSVRSISARISVLAADLSKTNATLSAKSEELFPIIKGIAEKIHTLENHLTATSAIIQRRVAELDTFVDETTDAARLQVLRIQAVVENVSKRVEETFDLLHQGVIGPATEITAIIKGVRVALDMLARHRRRPARTSHPEDEMFI